VNLPNDHAEREHQTIQSIA